MENNIKTIDLGVYGIKINLLVPQDEKGRYGAGDIISNIKEVCEHCGHRDCDFDCPDAQEYISDRDIDMQSDKQRELDEQRNYNYAIEGILSMILAHAMGGLDVESEVYIEGIETAVDACTNNI